jgi:hypothetical protein
MIFFYYKNIYYLIMCYFVKTLKSIKTLLGDTQFLLNFHLYPQFS